MTFDNPNGASPFPIDAETQQAVLNIVNEISEEIAKTVPAEFLAKLLKIGEKVQATSEYTNSDSKVLANTLSRIISTSHFASDDTQTAENNFESEQHLKKIIALLEGPEGDAVMALVSVSTGVAMQNNIGHQQV